MRFSERIGKNQPKVEIQLDFMDQELKNSLWNVVCMFITELIEKRQYLYESPFKSFVESIWFSFFKEPIDQIPYSTDSVLSELRNRFFSWNYLDTYDFIDFVASSETLFNYEEFIKACNFILKRELSGYRFVNGQLAPITNDQEIGEIEKAITAASDKSLVGIKTHLSEALNKLSDKKSPDYRNSIKESISAVESICQVITGDSKAELGKALKTLSSKLPIHGALEQGYIKIYGYTSDGDGIRHAMMDESSLDQEDALYMLISCSSFINYLMTKADKMGIELK
jgi:hypothetical protein